MASWRLKCRKKESIDHEHDEDCIIDPGHNYFILTKRPERIKECMDDMYYDLDNNWPGDTAVNALRETDSWPPKHIWIGTSVENNETAKSRITALAKVDWPNKFISFEPLLEDIKDLRVLFDYYADQFKWVIIGAETGAGKRYMHPLAAQNIVDECRPTGIPVFFKKNSYGFHTLFEKLYEEYPKGIK
jgi:protein gp37